VWVCARVGVLSLSLFVCVHALTAAVVAFGGGQPAACGACVCVSESVRVCVCVACAVVQVVAGRSVRWLLVACRCGGATASGSTGGPTGSVFLFFRKTPSPRADCASQRIFTERVPPALSEDTFAGTAGPRGHRRELPLGEAFTERKGPFSERILALGEGPQSGSV
jgi:hypothetical protein